MAVNRVVSRNQRPVEGFFPSDGFAAGFGFAAGVAGGLADGFVSFAPGSSVRASQSENRRRSSIFGSRGLRGTEGLYPPDLLCVAISPPPLLGDVVDHEGNPLEAECLPQAVLEEVGPVPDDQPAVIDLDRKPRRAAADLGRV